MIGVLGIAAFLTVLSLSLVITRITTIALIHTGLSHKAARFQARSAFTGTGYTTLVLAKAGYTFVSIDKDREALKTAALNLAYEKLLSHVKFYVMNGKSLAFESGSFKNIIVVNLFHHIDERDKVLSEINRVLCADGKVVMADFNRKGMDIVGTVHKEEGRVHEDCGTEMDYIHSYFRSLGYDIKNFDDK